MNNRPVYENLDTSFVNLAALVRYLRRRQMIGRVRLEFNSYEAEILLVDSTNIKVREHDKVAGRQAEGEEALQRLLIRAREPGGIIHVYQFVTENEKVNAEKPVVELKSVEEKIALELQPPPPAPQPAKAGTAVKPAKISELPQKIPSLVNRPNFPFELKNSVEEKARQQLNAQDWQTLLNLTAELLGTIDRSLSEAKLDFTAAFSKSRLEISPDYPFLNPSAKIFDYAGGKIIMREQVIPKLYIAGINEALRRILEKLGHHPKFTGIYRTTVQRILALINQRKSLYDKFFITPQLKKIIGA